MALGKVYLIGAGPGRPDLITVRGLEIIKQAEVIIYDYLVGERLVHLAKPGSKLINSHTLGKLPYHTKMKNAQKRINDLIVKEAKKGKKVLRLKNGDASIFSRISEEVSVLLANKIEYEIVPGVTAASAAAAYCGIPLTERGVAPLVTFVTGHESRNETSLIDWGNIAKLPTIVLYMAVTRLPKIVKELIALGRDSNDSVAVVTKVGEIDQKIVKGKLKGIAALAKKAQIKPPAMVIIGQSVRHEAKFNWFLNNRRILFTGLSDERFFLKGNYFYLPLIEIRPLESYQKLDKWIKKISLFDWLVFGSRFGVKYFFERLFSLGFDARVLAGLKLAVVGKSSAKELKRFGLKADLVPKVESSAGLTSAFDKEQLAGQRVFMPRSNLADKGLKKNLEQLGADVVSTVAYKNVMPRALPDLDLNFFDEIVFSSPSTVRNFNKRYKKVPQGTKVTAIGAVTKNELKRVFKR